MWNQETMFNGLILFHKTIPCSCCLLKTVLVLDNQIEADYEICRAFILWNHNQMLINSFKKTRT